MTTTTTTELRSSHSSHTRRNAVAAFAAAAIIASTVFVVSEILQGDSPAVGARVTNVAPLQGLGDIVAGSSFLNPVAATPLQGLGDIVAGMVAQR